jgi:serine/threonine protein kinase
MAPEVLLGQPYDTQADVYSFSVLLWEVLCLKWAFGGISIRDYYQRVCLKNERLPIPRIGWSPVLRIILAEGWDRNPEKRPTMIRYSGLIRGDLNEMSRESAVINRTQHMLNLSNRSMVMSGSMRGSRHG